MNPSYLIYLNRLLPPNPIPLSTECILLQYLSMKMKHSKTILYDFDLLFLTVNIHAQTVNMIYHWSILEINLFVDFIMKHYKLMSLLRPTNLKHLRTSWDIVKLSKQLLEIMFYYKITQKLTDHLIIKSTSVKPYHPTYHHHPTNHPKTEHHAQDVAVPVMVYVALKIMQPNAQPGANHLTIVTP